MNLWDNALNGLSEKMIEESLGEDRRIPSPDSDGYGPRHWIKWCAISAAVLILITGLSMLPKWSREIGDHAISTTTALPTVTALATEIAEIGFEKAYRTRIMEGEYQNYAEQRTCEEQYVGGLLGTVTVEAGWQNADGEYVSEEEHLQAQVYALKTLSPKAAICLRFLDQGDALTTEHYYVYRNPDSSIDVGSLGVHLGWWTHPTEEYPAPGQEGTVVGYTEGYSPAFEVTMPAATTSATKNE